MMFIPRYKVLMQVLESECYAQGWVERQLGSET